MKVLCREKKDVMGKVLCVLVLWLSQTLRTSQDKGSIVVDQYFVLSSSLFGFVLRIGWSRVRCGWLRQETCFFLFLF